MIAQVAQRLRLYSRQKSDIADGFGDVAINPMPADELGWAKKSDSGSNLARACLEPAALKRRLLGAE